MARHPLTPFARAFVSRWLVTGWLVTGWLVGAAVLAEPAWAQSAAELYGVSERAFEQGLYVPAADNLRALLRDYPDDALADDAEYLLALCRLYSGSYDQAARQLEQFGRRYPASPHVRSVGYWLGYARYSMGQTGGAISAFRAQVDGYPDEARYRQYALSYLGELYERSGERDKALDASRSLISSGAGGEMAATALYRVGSIELSAGRWTEAQAAFSRIRLEHTRSPLAATAHFYEAECLQRQGERGEARRRYRGFVEASAGRETELAGLREEATWRLAALASDLDDADGVLEEVGRLEAGYPESAHLAEALALRAEVLFDRGDLRGARAAYRASLERTQGPAARQRVAYDLAVCSIGLGEPTEALEYLESASSGPDAALATRSRYRQAVVHAGQGSAAKAIEVLRGVVALGASEEEILRFYGGLLDDAGRARDALPVWTDLCARFQSSSFAPRYLYRRGAAALALGDHALALEQWNALIRLHGDKPDASELAAEARYNIGYVYAARGEHVRALPYFAGAAEGSKDADLRSRSLFAQAVAAYNTEDYGGALSIFKRYVDSARDSASKGRGHLGLGKTALRTGDAQVAAASLRAAADLLGGTEEGAESLFWLGMALTRAGQSAAARDTYLEIIRRYASSARVPEAYLRAGVAARLAGDAASSAEYLARAVELLPAGDRSGPREEALYELGLSAVSLGRKADARRAFAQLGREYPGSLLAPEGFMKIAQVSFEAGRFTDAAAEFQEVSRSYPRGDTAGPALFWTAESWLRAGNADRAASGFWDYLKRFPAGSYAAACEAGIAGIAVASEDPGLLKRLYEAAEADTGVPVVLASRVRLEYAQALLERGLSGEADAVAAGFDADLLAEPYRGEAQLLQARLTRRRGSLEAALTVFEGLATSRIDRVGAEALLDLGETLAEAGKKQEAVTELIRLTVLFAQHKDLVPRALYAAMVLLREAGDMEGASRIETRLAREHPDFKAPR